GRLGARTPFALRSLHSGLDAAAASPTTLTVRLLLRSPGVRPRSRSRAAGGRLRDSRPRSCGLLQLAGGRVVGDLRGRPRVRAGSLPTPPPVRLRSVLALLVPAERLATIPGQRRRGRVLEAGGSPRVGGGD